MSRYEYLIDKIQKAEFSVVPFKHLYIEDFFTKDHFSEVIGTTEINVPPSEDDKQLFDSLFSLGYKIIEFPGCITDKEKYISWHSNRTGSVDIHSACEGFGMTLRLVKPRTEVLAELKNFLEGKEFNLALARKFDVELQICSIDNGIQKYLDGYEISPHPDIRSKALTFMVNVNPHNDADKLNHHTHYLTFKNKYDYVRRFWEENTDVERCWVPWDWCQTQSLQFKNNSIVIFSPSNDTLHAVKAAYNHLKGQRTQLYGNLWNKSRSDLLEVKWENLDICNTAKIEDRNSSFERKLRRLLPQPVKQAVRVIHKTRGIHTRNY